MHKVSYAEENVPPLTISPEKVCAIIVKAREFDVKDVQRDAEEGSNASDDGMVSVLEDHADDPVVEELVSYINDLNDDEQIELVTLVWLGRGLGTLREWGELRREAADAHNTRTARYLLGDPLLPDYLEEGLSMFGHSCEEFESEVL